jgi:hypothetical protein
MEVDFCPVLCIPKVPVSQDFRGISHFVLYCKAAREREEVILKQLEEKEPLPDGAMRNCIEYVLRKKRQNRQKQKFVAKGKGLSWKSVKPKKK